MKSQRKGNSTGPPNANPFRSDRMNIGSQINTAKTVARLAGRAKSGLIKPERIMSLKNGPPFVKEKSLRFEKDDWSIVSCLTYSPKQVDCLLSSLPRKR